MLLFTISYVFSQTNDSGIETDMQESDVMGIWENSSKIIHISSETNGVLQANIVLKTFYGFYYDGTYPNDESVPVNLARLGDGVYTEYWVKGQAYDTLGDPILQEEEENPVFKVKIERPMQFDSTTAKIADGILWLPQSNTQELSIDSTIEKTEVVGYYVDGETTYEIRYWITDVAYSDEKAELSLNDSDEQTSVFIDKYIQIGDAVYTCATGLRTKIRNVTTIEPFGDDAFLNDSNTVLVFGEPYLVLSDISNVEDAILAHNSIPRPPRNGKATFVEPSIYKKLEQMTIEDFDNPYAPIH